MASRQTGATRARTWRAHIKNGGMYRYLGTYATKAEAEAVEAQARAEALAAAGVTSWYDLQRCTCPGGPWYWPGAHDATCPAMGHQASEPTPSQTA